MEWGFHFPHLIVAKNLCETSCSHGPMCHNVTVLHDCLNVDVCPIVSIELWLVTLWYNCNKTPRVSIIGYDYFPTKPKYDCMYTSKSVNSGYWNDCETTKTCTGFATCPLWVIISCD